MMKKKGKIWSLAKGFSEDFWRTAVALGKKTVKMALAVKTAQSAYIDDGGLFIKQQLCRQAEPLCVDECGVTWQTAACG